MRPARKDLDQVTGQTIEPVDIEGDPMRGQRVDDTAGGDAIVVEPIEIQGTVPQKPDWTGRDEEPTSWAIAEALESLYPNFDNGELPAGKGLGTYSPGAVAGGALEAMTLGHGDELMGAIGSAQGESYEGTRDRARDRMARAREENPGSVGAGEALGIGATLPLLGGAGAAESTLGRLATGVVEGLGFGALGAEGASENDFLSEQWAEDVRDGGLEGAAIGGAFGLGAEGLRRGLGRLAGDSAERARAAGYQRLRQAGAERAPDLRRMGRQGTPEEVAQDLRDLGVFGESGWASRDDAAAALAGAGQRAGQQLGDIRAPLADELVDLADVYHALKRRFDELGTDPSDFAKDARNAIRSQTDAIERAARERGSSQVPFSDLDRIRRNAGVSTSDARRAAESGRAHANNLLYSLLADLEDAAVERLAPGLVGQYRGSMRPYELMKAMGEVSNNAELRDAARSAMGLSDYAAMAMGEGRGDNPAGSVAAWMLNRLFQGREPAVRANWNEAMGRLGESVSSGGVDDALQVLRRAVGDATATSDVSEALTEGEPIGPAVKELPELTEDDQAWLEGDALSDDDRAWLEGE